MWLLIDDARNENVDIIARSADAGILLLNKLQGVLTGLVIDYDLGDVEVSGYDIIMYAVLNKLLPPVVQIVSANPVGRKRIHDALIHDAKYLKQGVNYMRPENGDVVK